MSDFRVANALEGLVLDRGAGLPGLPDQFRPRWRIGVRSPTLVRIRMLTPYLAKGTTRFNGDSPGARLLVNPLWDFPLGDHDDGPDSLAMAVRLIRHLLRDIPVEEYVCA